MMAFNTKTSKLHTIICWSSDVMSPAVRKRDEGVCGPAHVHNIPL